jgi:methionine sulfoxide reductase heme-binding subunit
LIRNRLAKPCLFLACLAPLAWLALIGPEGWGANLVETFNRFLGDWALRFLLLTLGVTPLAQLTRQRGIIRFRRMLGLFAFFYACLHLSSYVVFDQFFDLNAIWQDVVKRKFITVGMACFLALVPLAITSVKRLRNAMTARTWQRLHTAIYPIAMGVVLHNFMMVKANYREVFIHVVILAVLLGWRLAQRFSGGRRATK